MTAILKAAKVFFGLAAMIGLILVFCSAVIMVAAPMDDIFYAGLIGEAVIAVSVICYRIIDR